MPDARLARTRASLPEGYQFLDAVFGDTGEPHNILFQRYLRENARDRQFKTWADVVDDAAMRTVYETVYSKP